MISCKFIYLCLFIFILVTLNSFQVSSEGGVDDKKPPATYCSENCSFAIDYENDQFLLDGKPFRYVAGSFHYFRTPRQKWSDILRKMRGAGLNAVSTYVEWSMHEPEPNQWVWDGDADLLGFIEAALQEELFVILRPGPYICAERDFGGFPYWLLKLVPDIKLRTNDERYLHYAERYLDHILEKVKPYLRGNGGPIIMVQIENEYGSFSSCNSEYKKKLHEIFDRHVENKAVLFTTDGPTRNMLNCGTIPGVYATIDFGAGANIEYNNRMMRQFTPKGPLVNSEFYPGWLTHWGEKFQRVASENVEKTLDDMLKNNYSVNFYMFFGGTNFGFTSGANINNYYWPQLTSYDYDAPLNEAGDPTPKYFALSNVISKYLPLPNSHGAYESPKKNYGQVTMRPMLDLFTQESRDLFGTPEMEYTRPPTFEALGLSNYLVLYEASLPSIENATDLTLETKVKDRALIYVNDVYIDHLERMENRYNTTLPNKNGKHIKLLVENQGRVNYGSIDVEDFKGIFEPKLNNITIQKWKVTGFRLSSVTEDDFMLKNTKEQIRELTRGPQFLVGHFHVYMAQPLDTYLNTEGWGKGVAYMNGHNLGRYWPARGPQMTLYVPAEYLKKGKNTLVLLELEYVPDSRTITLQNSAVLDYHYSV